VLWHGPLFLAGQILWTDVLTIVAASVVIAAVFHSGRDSVLTAMLLHATNNAVGGSFACCSTAPTAPGSGCSPPPAGGCLRPALWYAIRGRPARAPSSRSDRRQPCFPGGVRQRPGLTVIG
jgi:hypothetical protein